MHEEVCKKLRKMLAALFRKAFQRDFEANLDARGQELWVLGIDAKAKTFIDVCGTIDPAILADITHKASGTPTQGIRRTYKTCFRSALKKRTFLLNTAHFNAKPGFLEPLVVHELAHLLWKRPVQCGRDLELVGKEHRSQASERVGVASRRRSENACRKKIDGAQNHSSVSRSLNPEL
jgi:hypothetical protein